MDTKNDIIWYAIGALTMVAALILAIKHQNRTQQRKRMPSDETPTKATPADASPARRGKRRMSLEDQNEAEAAFTAREMRQMRADRTQAEGGCIVEGCPYEATRPMPSVAYVLGNIDINSVIRFFLDPTEMPAVWRIASSSFRAEVCLCQTHHSIATVALNEKIAGHHTKSTQFFADLREEMISFSRHGLIEHLDAVEMKMRNGSGEGTS